MHRNVSMQQFVLFFLAAVSIGFDSSEYRVREDEGRAQVCLRFRGPLKNNSFVELSITISTNNSGGEVIAIRRFHAVNFKEAFSTYTQISMYSKVVYI